MGKIFNTPVISAEKPTKTLPGEIDVDQLMLHSRQLHLTGPIMSKQVQPIINKIMALQLVGDEPIILWINSGGGYCCDGFALIDCMRFSKVPIITVVRGEACSMAGLISIAGHTRVITENSWWMAHDVHSASYDYVTKMEARVQYNVRLQKQVLEFLKTNTKLTVKDMEQARNKELWLQPQECLEKGIVDQVIRFKVKGKKK